MTLIPMMSAMLSSRRNALAAGDGTQLLRGSYNPGAGHRPIAAVFAIGLPAALFTVVALTPMISIITEKHGPTVVHNVPEEKKLPPPPEDDPAPKQKTAPETEMTTVPTPFPPINSGPLVDPLPPVPPAPLPPLPPGPVADPAPPPPAPKLVLAQLDQRFIAGFQPDYPAREQREEMSGVTIVRVLIGTDGKVKQVELVSTDSPGFFEATKRRALSKWRFKPATRGGVAEESWKEMKVRFEIKNA